MACSGSDGEAIDAPDTDGTDGSPAATRPSGEPQPITVEGRISDGVECPVLTTPDGDVWSLSLGEADFGPGDYVRFTGERMDASICMQGKGTLVPERIEEIDPPARDRDPARAGGVKLTVEYVTGSWVAKGPDADCDRPDFRIVTSPAATVLQGDISRHDDSALVVLDQYPRIDLDEPMDDLPIESRGPDGLAILRPATDAEYDPIRIGSATIKGDGVVFVKCG
ncbi:hypothetical protein ELI_07465 [Erythrobacter litoralis HTCC2594]|uniref:Uncharacterized protein n=1 Tax=Erythrobacter litoralis (strain HTCC2594) TaxID=314225 RepID=Q2N9Q6_ERYLH|nr:hypothetical protein ELI_07465 [Erythrobacter litoralis HTCC2594]